MIDVAVPVVVLLFAALLTRYFYRQRRQNKSINNRKINHVKTELDDTHYPPALESILLERLELPEAVQIKEMSPGSHPYELPADTGTCELE